MPKGNGFELFLDPSLLWPNTNTKTLRFSLQKAPRFPFKYDKIQNSNFNNSTFISIKDSNFRYFSLTPSN